MNTTHFFLLAIIVGIVGGAYFFLSERGTSSESDLARLGSIALTDYEGATVSLGDFEGKPLVVNTWAAWCPFCKQELPDFATLQKEFPKIVVIAIDRQEPLEVAKGYTDGLGISHDMVFLLDPRDEFYKNIGGFSMPETIFVNAAGDIAFHKRGPMTLEEMREAVKQYLR